MIRQRKWAFQLSLLVAIHLTSLCGVARAEVETKERFDKILASFVDDFRSDRAAAEPRSFGVSIPGAGDWHIDVAGEKQGDVWAVELSKGLPKSPTFVYTIEPETLIAIDSGQINALTAQGKESSGQYTPMSVSYMDGFKPTIMEVGEINPFSFHFWTRGFPEVVPFRGIQTREAHGSNFGVFYYQTGLRTGWYRVEPGERVHEGQGEQAMPFPILAIATRGVTEGEVDGKRVSLPAGNAVFIPAHAQHKWWNESDEPAEAIVVMFGEGA
ncbi:MAG: cupin domain-containing protein [Planctomycetota bacterium]